MIAYIEANREEIEIEYQDVLRYAEEVREYWEERNQEQFAKVSAMEPPSGTEELWAKLRAWKDKLELESEPEDDSQCRPND